MQLKLSYKVLFHISYNPTIISSLWDLHLDLNEVDATHSYDFLQNSPHAYRILSKLDSIPIYQIYRCTRSNTTCSSWLLVGRISIRVETQLHDCTCILLTLMVRENVHLIFYVLGSIN